MDAIRWPRLNPVDPVLAPLAMGAVCALAAVSADLRIQLALLSPMIAAGVLWWSVNGPNRWLFLFFPCLLLTPPIPAPVGDAGLHFAPVPALMGLLFGGLHLRHWTRRLPVPALALAAFTAALLLSIVPAALYSGPNIAFGSLLRVGLFSIAVYVFFYSLAGPEQTDAESLRFTRFLFICASVAALFACVDFYLQLPAPAGFEAQYVWLDEGVFRRAQGLFYEASTLGNFCAFFLTMIAVALLRPRRESPCSRILLLAGGALFAAALIFSYSRASVLNVVVALTSLLFLRSVGRVRIWKPLCIGILVSALSGFAVNLALPSFSASYWARIANSFQYFWYSPDGILSGRLNSWTSVANYLSNQPWHAIFGVGYKTLAYSDVTGAPLIVDNTWLSLLAETGIIGLTAFVFLNVSILRYSYRAARSARSASSFFGEWIFCFWIGEMVQMMSGDLVTYWRVLPLYFWVLGAAIRERVPN